MHIKKSAQFLTEEDAESFAKALGVSVEDLKNQSISLYDLIGVLHDKQYKSLFSSAQSVFRSTVFWTIQYSLERNKIASAKQVEKTDAT